MGMASLTEDEYNSMDINTTYAVNDHSQRLVTIEVFHQLHCLVSALVFSIFSDIDHEMQNYLRRRIYEVDGVHFQVESDWSRDRHLCKWLSTASIKLVGADYSFVAHCIDYLRQVLMCHADMTPITLDLVPHKYNPNFSIKHTCRNWDRVWDFALERNISGSAIE